MNRIRTLVAATALVGAVSPAVAQVTTTTDVANLTLEELLNARITSTASKFPQSVADAPASITIVTAEEIRRLGHRTLADILRSVRGMYVTDDRNYSYTGVRGLARPGDYNTRVLLLVDGHRLNDPIYDMAPIGTDLPVDMRSIDRVEIMRGPGSALYGTNALFAVINVITRSGRQDQGIGVTADAGTLGTQAGHVSSGHLFGNGAELLLSASAAQTNGPHTLYFPEFDVPGGSDGVVVDGDRDRSAHASAAFSIGRITVRAAQAERTKQVPTASFGTIFGDRQYVTRDQRGYADLSYTGPLFGGWTGVARGGYDRYHYRGGYPYDYGELGTIVLDDRALADWVSSEVTASRRAAQRHFVTVGAEVRYGMRQTQLSRELTTTLLDDRRHTTTWGSYVQDSVSVARTLVLIGGARLDRYESFGTEVTPRAALVFTPSRQSTVKVMHGRAFRAPNGYELYYSPPADYNAPALEPERLRTTEGTWEQYYGPQLRSTVSLFRSRIDGVITQQDGNGPNNYFANLPGARSDGAEVELEARTRTGITLRGSHSWTHAVAADDTPLTNSPTHLTKYDAILPLVSSRLFLGTTGIHTSARLTTQGVALPAFYVQNVTLTADRIARRLNLSLSVLNLFDRRYGDPGAEEHVQVAIPQDGRTARLSVSLSF